MQLMEIRLVEYLLMISHLFLEWCKEGQFVCGHSRYCIDQNKVCDGSQDCPAGEDEKKCAALIDGNVYQYFENERIPQTPSLNKDEQNYGKRPNNNHHGLSIDEEDTKTFEKLVDYDQLAVESSVRETTTIQSEELTESLRDKNITDVISGREIASNSKNSLVSENSFQASTKTGTSFTKNSIHREINSYNDKGFLHVRKNGKWGKLCLGGINSLLEERQTTWTVEDLGRAVCKAITYQ